LIKGTYIFYDGDKEICRSENVITQFGKRFLTNFIAGNVNFNKKDLAFGIGRSAATSQDSRLEFEFYRMPVEFGSMDIQQTGVDGQGNPTYGYTVIYTSTLPQDVVGKINEIGLYPGTRSSINNFDSKFISEFTNQLDWSPNPLYLVSDNSRVGEAVLAMTSDGTSTREYKTSIYPIDLSGYSINDSITLAYYKTDNNLENITVRFYSSDTAYYDVLFTPTSGIEYKIHEVQLSDLFNDPHNSPDPSQINQIGILINPTSSATTVHMDALRINDEDTFDPTFGIISRSVLPLPGLDKLAGRQVRVQYRLDLGF
jgi:hypothetical protein